MNLIPTRLEGPSGIAFLPKQLRTQRRKMKQRCGATLALLALMLPVVLAVAAYAINVVYMEMARTELQITIDVATRAAGRTFAVTGDRQKAIAAADRMMFANPFANEKMTLRGSEVVFGVSTRYSENDRYAFKIGPNPNAVQIQANGKIQVPMLFPTMGVPIDFRPIKTSISTQTEIDIALVLDRSGSMAFASDEISGPYNPAAAPLGWTFGEPAPPRARWLDAVTSINLFLDLLSATGHNEFVSMSSYNELPKLDTDLSNDYLRIKNAMFAYTASFGDGATNIGDGILCGASALSSKKSARPWATRVMIVLTDGIHNVGTDPLMAAQVAASQNILIYTITFSDEAEQLRMEQVALTGHGKHYHASTGAELTMAFEEISRVLPTLITY